MAATSSKGYVIVRRKWKARRTMYYLMAFELLFLIPILTLFGLSQPDVYRTLMWRIGYAQGFNSNPDMILYAYANFQPLPAIPFVWSQAITDFNVAISIISLFSLLSKLIAFIMKVYFPIVGVVVSFIQVALYATSVYGQAGPDYADPRHPSPVAWYIAKSCSFAAKYGAEKSCMIAKSAFAVTVLMLAVYVANLAFSIWNMIPTKFDSRFNDNDEDEDEDSRSHSRTPSPDKLKAWEMQPQTPRAVGVGPTPTTPFTPRTQAFHTLERKLPFRQYA